jgi:hypothetical protein
VIADRETMSKNLRVKIDDMYDKATACREKIGEFELKIMEHHQPLKR